MHPQIQIGTVFTEYIYSFAGEIVKLWQVEKEIDAGIYSCLPEDEEYRCQFTETEIIKLLNTKQ
jgi:regulation of enolase protein 1 (concanavalin A-like superfamily)